MALYKFSYKYAKRAVLQLTCQLFHRTRESLALHLHRRDFFEPLGPNDDKPGATLNTDVQR